MAATASAFFDSVSSNIVSATRSATGTMEAALVRGVQSNVAHLTSALATGIREAISTGMDVVGRAIDEASNRASEVLQGVVSRVREWGNTLTQNVLSGLSRVLGGFVNRFGGALSGAPERLRQFVGRFLQGIGNAARGAPGRVVHGAGRLGAGGDSLLGNLWARLREGVANLTQSLAGVFQSLSNNARAVLGNLWNTVRSALQSVWTAFTDGLRGVTTVSQTAFHGAVTTLGRQVRAAFSAAWTSISGLATAVWSALDAALNGALKAVVSAVSAAASNPYVLVAAIVALVGGLYAVVNAATTAAFNAVAGVGRFAAGAIRSGWSLVAPVLSRVWGALVSGWQTVSRVFQNFWGWLTATVSKLWKSLSSVASSLWQRFTAALPGIISGARAFISNFFSFIIGALKIGVAGVAMGAFAKAVYEAAKSAMELAKNVQALSASSGLSFGAANQVLQRGRALGIADSATAGVYGGEARFIQRLKAAVFGLPGADNAGFNSAAAARFQQLRGQGPAGQMMANAMAKLMGLTSPEQQQMLMMNPAKIRAQERWVENLNARIGNTPDVLRKFAEDVPLAFGKIGAAWSSAQIRLAVVAAPIMERVLGPVINWLGANAEKISAAIEAVARWMFVKAPVMLADGLATVTGITVKALDFLIGFGQMLATNLPKWLGVAAAKVAEIMLWLANGIKEYAPVVIGAISGMFQAIGETVGGWLDAIADILGDVATNPANPLRKIIMQVANFFDGLAFTINRFVNDIVTSPAFILLNPTLAGKMAAATDLQLQKGNISVAVQNWFKDPQTQKRFQDASNATHSVANAVRNNSNAVAGFVDRNGNLLAGAAERGLRAGANFIAPPGEDNIGVKAGNIAAGYINQGVGFLRDTIKPAADTINSAAQAFKDGVGTEEQRDRTWQNEMLKQAREQTASLQQMARDGQAMPAATDAVAATMLLRYAKESGAAVRRLGT